MRKRGKRPIPTGNINAVKGSGARAVFSHHAAALHNIEFTFVTDEGESFTVTMEHLNAREFLNSAIAAYQATLQPLQIARNVPFGQ